MQSEELYNDKALLHLASEGKEDAFATIYIRYYDFIKNFILKYIHIEPLAQDLTQDLFIKFWEKKNELKNVQNLRAYLIVSARNHTLNAMRSMAKSDAALCLLIQSYKREEGSIDTYILDKDYQEFLQNTLAQLPEKTRKIFRECRENERKYDEVAAELGISRDAVKKHMVGAMKHISNALKSALGLSIRLLFMFLPY